MGLNGGGQRRTGRGRLYPASDRARTDRLHAITEYDPKSVTHYPCQGVDNKELALSADDRTAAATLYGPPGKPQPAPVL